MKQNKKTKLSLEKFQIAKIKNPQFIYGGLLIDNGDNPKTTPTAGGGDGQEENQ